MAVQCSRCTADTEPRALASGRTPEEPWRDRQGVLLEPRFLGSACLRARLGFESLSESTNTVQFILRERGFVGIGCDDRPCRVRPGDSRRKESVRITFDAYLNPGRRGSGIQQLNVYN